MKSVFRKRRHHVLATRRRAIYTTAAWLLLAPLCTIAHAQTAASHTVERGRELLDADDVRAVETLRAAAQDALNDVAQASAAVTAAAATAGGSTQAVSEALFAARERAAEVHLLWGEAADRFSRRDEAIAAYSRAIALAVGPRPELGGIVAPRVARDARSAISGLLRAGLPLQAPDDVMETLAHSVQGDLWVPRRFSFKLPASIAAPGAAAPGTQEFLITEGKLFPPENLNAVPGMSRLARVAPLYRAVAPDALPSSLKMDRVLYGYVRETAGPTRGLWRQVARVYYASNYLTRDNRDDRPRATVLCEQFLRTWALSRSALALDNPFAADGVTTLWLIEVSSWWPEDDDDPLVAAQMGRKMPVPNTPLKPNEQAVPPVTASPLTRPWRASAQMDSAPGEIMFFKAAYARDEAEWLRQMTHEYGHVALPPFEGFMPPLEPLGNGALGETLAALWMSGDAGEWAPTESTVAALKKAAPRPPAPDEDAPAAEPAFIEFDRTAFASSLSRHAALNALAAFEYWKTNGPVSPLAKDTSRDGLRYLCGAALGIERVYGAPMLGATLRTLKAERKTGPRTVDLLGAFAIAQSDAPLGTIWLAGALDVDATDAAAIRDRRPVTMRQGHNTVAWLYVPPGANNLRVFYSAAPGNKTMPRVSLAGKNSVARAERNGGYSSLISLGGARGWTKLQFQSYATVSVGLAQWEK